MADFDPDKYLEKKKKSEPFDPDKYLASTKPETAAQTFGRSAASLADTALNAITGTLDYAAYPLARAFGRTPQQATAETTSPKDVVGRMFGVTGTPGYENAPLRSIGRTVGEAIGENVVQPIASATGLPEQDVGSMITSATMGLAPVVPKVANATVSAGQKALPIIKAPIDIGKGLYQGGIKGVEPGSAKSAVVPLRDTYYPPEAVQAYMRGEMDLATLQASQRPSSSLFATPEQKSALRMAERMPGEPDVPLIPVQGKGMQAFGERIGREYVTDPYRAAADVGLSVIAGVPLPLSAAQRAMQAKQSRTLSQAAQFDPMFRQKLFTDIEAQANMPPAPGPVRPAPPAPVTSPADLALQRSQQTAQTSGNIVQQQAAQRLPTPAPKPEPIPTPAPQPSQSLFAGQPSQPKPATVTQPTTTARTSKTIRQELDNLDRRNNELYQNVVHEKDAFDAVEINKMRNEMQDLYPKIQKLQTELDQALKLEKKQTRAAKKKGPGNVSQMMTTDVSKIPQEYHGPNLTAAMLRESGEWTQNGKQLKVEKLSNGQTRFQVRENGKVIDERFL